MIGPREDCRPELSVLRAQMRGREGEEGENGELAAVHLGASWCMSSRKDAHGVGVFRRSLG